MGHVLLVGGGTAGHVLPAIATAHALEQLRPDIGIAFAGRIESLEERLVTNAGYDFHAIEAVPLPRRPDVGLLRVLPRLARSVRMGRTLLQREAVGVVVSFGGYVALPLSLAARGRVPLVLHEQNSRPGLANRIAGRFADQVAVTFPSSIERIATPGRVRIVGNPIHPRLRALDRMGERTAARGRLGLDPSGSVLLVLGGSQGARSINRSVAAAAAAWRALDLQVVHLTGERGFEESVDLWRAADVDPMSEGSRVRVIPFLDDMADAYVAADAVLSRAGATTLAEISVLGLPSVLVPYPHATAQHQRWNAQALANAGAALMVDDAELTPDLVASLVASIVTDPARAGSMAHAARAWGRPDAAEALASLVIEALGASGAPDA